MVSLLRMILMATSGMKGCDNQCMKGCVNQLVTRYVVWIRLGLGIRLGIRLGLEVGENTSICFPFLGPHVLTLDDNGKNTFSNSAQGLVPFTNHLANTWFVVPLPIVPIGL